MLKWIKIRNFQCHQKKFIKLDPHVTTVIGPNDSGKSAIVRALKWVFTNRPVGQRIRRHGSKTTSVRIGISGCTLSRSIKGIRSTYKINNTEYKALRGNVPPRIRNLVNIADINFQTQHSPIFWFDLTPGRVAKELNQLVDLESIDRAQELISRKLRHKKTELEICRQRLKEAQTQIDSLWWIKPILGKLGNIDDRYAEYRLKSSTRAAVAFYLDSAIRVNEDRKRLALGLPIAHAAMTAAGAAIAAAKRAERLQSLIRGVHDAKRGVIAIPPLPAFPTTTSSRLSQLVNQMEMNLQEQKKLDREIKQGESNLEEKLGGRCPTCGTILSNETLV